MEIVISTSFGLEAVLKRELYNLGYENVKASDGKISVEGNLMDIARFNVNLRTADRVFIKLAEFKATTFDELFDSCYKINWSEYIDKDNLILLNGHCSNSQLMAIKVSGGIIKKSIVKNLQQKYKCELLETGSRVNVFFNINKDIVSIYLDTSGEGLHKRGYRKYTHSAPIKETLGAGLVLLSVYNKEKPFADLFCGSGTLAIETALIAKNIAPNINRNFDFEKWKIYNSDVVSIAKKEAKEREVDCKPNIYACDIDEKAIEIAKLNASRAGVLKDIKFEVRDMKNFKSKESFGVIISNPPYGERIGNVEEIQHTLKDLNKVVNQLKTWSCYLITDEKNLERLWNKKATKKRKLYNSNIECVYYSFMGPKPVK